MELIIDVTKCYSTKRKHIPKRKIISTHKICKCCKIEKNVIDFTKSISSKDGYLNTCKSCSNIKNKEHRIRNKETYNEYSKKYKLKNRSQLNKSNRKYYKKRKNNPSYKLLCNLRSRLRYALKSQRATKNIQTLELLGCTKEEFKLYIQSKFTETMNWNNYGLHGWHIDHIIPCAAFNLTDQEQLKKCCHYTNLQPLWCTDNWKKSNKIPSRNK